MNYAKDFYKGQIVGTADYSNAKINDHHLFPSEVVGLDPAKSTKFSIYKDSIANRTLLLDETNQKISNSRPSEYLEDMITKHGDEATVKEILSSHFITDAAYEYMKQDDFDNFILERENAIREHLISSLGLS